MKRIIIFQVALILIGASVVLAQNLEYVGSTDWSTANDIDVVGNYAYCAFANGLEIFDISNPVSPVFVSRLFIEGQGQQIQLVGQYAYLTDGTIGLRIINISSPADPILVGTCDTPVFADKFAISGNYAFVTDSSPDLQIIDISSPANPFMAGTFHGDDNFRTIAIEGNYAYVSGLVLDITDPVNPVRINAMLAGGTDDICIEGGRLFSISAVIFPDTESIFEVWDISNPYNPIYVAHNYISIRKGYDIKAIGDFVYIVSEGGLIIIEVPEQNNPPLTIHGIGANGFGISIQDTLAYVVGETYIDVSFLRTIDITRPDSAIILNNYYFGYRAYDVTVNGNYAYVPGLGIVNVSDPASPNEVVPYHGNFVQRIIVSENYAFMGSDYYGVSIYDISDPINPITLSYIPVLNYGRIMAVSGNYFYEGTIAGLDIYDISDIRNPVLTARYPQSGPNWDIAISGHYILAEADDELLAIDVSDPHQPTLVNSYPSSNSYMRRIFVGGNYAYITGQNGLRVFDISNLPEVTLVGQYETDFDLNSITVEGNYAFAVEDIEDNIAKLLVLDISNPSNPSLMTSIDLPYGASEVTTANGYIYVANKSAMLIFRLNPTEIKERNSLPLLTSLSQNYPNPFNATTSIKYSLSKSGQVVLSIYNLLGQKVATLSDGIQAAGEHSINWNAGDFSSGVYFARLESRDASRNIRMILLK